MFPLNLKQQKATAISQLYAPRVQEIQRKYKNNQEKLQEEMGKLQKEGYNPTGGCGVMAITMLLLFGVIDVVYKPMTHMEHFDGDSINAIETVAEDIDIAHAIIASPDDYQALIDYIANPESLTIVKTKQEDGTETSNQVKFAEGFNYEEARKSVVVTQEQLDKIVALTDEQIAKLYDGNSRLSNEVKNLLKAIDTTYYADGTLYSELRAINCYADADNQPLFKNNSSISADILTRLDSLSDNMFFFGLNLGEQPTLAFNALLIIPIISFVLSFAQMFISQKFNEKQNPEVYAAQQGQQAGCMKGMLYTMPLMSLWIAFSVPAGAGFYWAISYLFSIAQTFITYKFWPSDKIRAEAKAKMEAAAAKVEQRATVVEVNADGETVERTERISQLTQKEIKELNRQKLEAARRADAEKYGEEYKDMPDDDF